ncbi:Uncharacterised protein [Mycobacteroides abscessus subsp. abscessus]|nr:Uncharacterised protein [Mycobacteroides abscessus subsp. abscessus]
MGGPMPGGQRVGGQIEFERRVERREWAGRLSAHRRQHPVDLCQSHRHGAQYSGRRGDADGSGELSRDRGPLFVTVVPVTVGAFQATGDAGQHHGPDEAGAVAGADGQMRHLGVGQHAQQAGIGDQVIGQYRQIHVLPGLSVDRMCRVLDACRGMSQCFGEGVGQRAAADEPDHR